MESKHRILSQIRAGLPPPWPLPEVPVFRLENPDKPGEMARILERGATQVARAATISDVNAVIDCYNPQRGKTLSTFPDSSDSALPSPGSPSDCEGTDLAVLEAVLGVAENGAIWISERELQGLRILPFITQHLVLVVREKTIVGTMHEAYAKLGRPEAGFGVFIGGPSKTADIEQSLVIGAQAARSLLVIIIP